MRRSATRSASSRSRRRTPSFPIRSDGASGTLGTRQVPCERGIRRDAGHDRGRPMGAGRARKARRAAREHEAPRAEAARGGRRRITRLTGALPPAPEPRTRPHHTIAGRTARTRIGTLPAAIPARARIAGPPRTSHGGKTSLREARLAPLPESIRRRRESDRHPERGQERRDRRPARRVPQLVLRQARTRTLDPRPLRSPRRTVRIRAPSPTTAMSTAAPAEPPGRPPRAATSAREMKTSPRAGRSCTAAPRW